jgi:chromosome segregation ATPase
VARRKAKEINISLAIKGISESLLKINGGKSYAHRPGSRRTKSAFPNKKGQISEGGIVLDNNEFQELVLEQLKSLGQGQKSLEQGQKSLTAQVANIDNRLSNVEQGQKALTAQVASIDNRLGNVEQGQKLLEQGQIVLVAQVASIDNRLSNVEQGQKALTAQVASIDNRLGNVEQGQKLLEQGQIALATQVASIDNRLGNVEQGQKTLATRIDNLEQDQQIIIKTLHKHSAQFDNLEKSQQETNQRLAQLENNVENQLGDKVRVLFDAHSLYLDYFESLKDGQARIEKSVSFISTQQINYENKLRDYDREIRLIRSEKKKQS